MTINEKYTSLLGKYIYNKKLDKFGYISSLEIMRCIGELEIYFVAFYDTFDSHKYVSFEDFEKKEIQFALITGYPKSDEQNNKNLEDIKNALGDKFSEEMILYISDEKRKEKILKNNMRNTQILCNDIIDITNISAKVMSNDFYSRELYLKYKNGAITKLELLYALINHLSQELERRDTQNKDYFFKYEFLSEIEEAHTQI